MAIVRIGLFDDAEAGETLLLDGDEDGLRELARVMETLARGKTDALQMHTLSFVEVREDMQLVALPCADNLGIVPTETNALEWRLTRSGWDEASETVCVVSRKPPRHRYLNATGDAVAILVSSGEYGQSWWDAQT